VVRTVPRSLPVAGRTGTLANRFLGTPGEGNVRATGSVRESRALSGYVTTASGRQVVFSLVVNGALPPAVIPAMDNLVSSMAAARI
jgi:serine-type D-Ala-D-Ala carboxypeptidase/endopeptidase (penicillin-binding protein 4)